MELKKCDIFSKKKREFGPRSFKRVLYSKINEKERGSLSILTAASSLQSSIIVALKLLEVTLWQFECVN